MGETPDHIREDIEETRARMGDTVEAIGYKADVKSRMKDTIVEKKDAVVVEPTRSYRRVSGAVPLSWSVSHAALPVVHSCGDGLRLDTVESATPTARPASPPGGWTSKAVRRGSTRTWQSQSGRWAPSTTMAQRARAWSSMASGCSSTTRAGISASRCRSTSPSAAPSARTPGRRSRRSHPPRCLD